MRTPATLALLVASGCQLVFPLDGPKTGIQPNDGSPEAGDSDALLSGSCPPAYILDLGTGSRYRLGTQTINWIDAANDCVADQSGALNRFTHLVVLSDAAEYTAIDTGFGSDHDALWIGLTDRQLEGTFQTVSTEPLQYPQDTTPSNSTPPWGNNEPDDNGDEDGVRYIGEVGTPPRSLDDFDETQGMLYLCECDTFAPDPAKYNLNVAVDPPAPPSK
ncbi:MAG TPA: C-type lectin domain-containing protein [Kofleriaceae bacterium]|nr:C-type lectin domain-containing protein [Kofleriaceae bacterium]